MLRLWLTAMLAIQATSESVARPPVPGATNMITGAASAYENNVPMLVITAQSAISTFGKGAIQDSLCTGINTVGLYQHCIRSTH